MKLSKYNFFLKYYNDDAKLIAYNSKSGAVALIDKNDLIKLKKIISKEANNEKLILDFAKGDFVIDDDINELDDIKYNLLSSRYSTNSLGLTIAPTLGCNFDCVYCYEKNHDNFSKMNEDVQNAIVDYINNIAPTIKDLYISWYGGEPLLAFDVIENISKKIIKICNENNVDFSAGIVTNGYLLNDTTIKKLSELNITSIQITLDGEKEYHDKRRFLKGGLPTYDKIVENLKLLNKHNTKVSLRINTDKNNYTNVNNILYFLDEYSMLDNITPYLGFVENYNECYNKESCLSLEDFADINYNFIKSLDTIKKQNNKYYYYPKRKNVFCCADNNSAFVINNYGDLYKCWNDIEYKEKSLGNILSKNIALNSYHKKILLFDPTENAECKECKFLPICMGGCPHKRLSQSNGCTEQKYKVENNLNNLVNELIKHKKLT